MGYSMLTKRCIAVVLLFGMYAWCYGQSSVQSHWPEERGLILTTFNRYSWGVPVQLRHLPMYPGYENFSGRVPGVNLSNPNIHFRSIDVDYKSKCIYMYEYHLRKVVLGTGYNHKLDRSSLKFTDMHVGVSRGTVQVAVDWLSHTVYWTDSLFRWIVAAPGLKNKTDFDYYKIIVDKHLDAPDGLTVDPLEGYLFWSDNGKHPKIERSDLKGDNRHTIVSRHLDSPMTLEADIFGKRIYWIDSISVLSATYDGEDVISIQKIPTSNLFDLAIFREVLYISDIRNGNVYTLNKTKGIDLGKQESTTIRIFPETIYGLAVYGGETQPLKDKDYCAEENCDHLCISTKTGAKCLCSEGYEVDESNGKCQETSGRFYKAIVVANKTHVCLTDVRSFAERSQHFDCKFTINKLYPATSTPSPARRKKRQALTSPKPTVNSPTSRSSIRSTSARPKSSSTAAHKSTSTAKTHSVSTTRPEELSTERSTTTPTTGQTSEKTTAPSTEESVGLIKIFDMDMENRIFFFATENNTIYKRPIDLPIENGVTETIVKTSGTISGLSYDAEDPNNLYWCESDTGEVWVVNVQTKASKIVSRYSNRLTNVKHLVVVFKQRVLAMITGSTGYMSIETMAMDGSDIKYITRGRSTISTFTFDSEKQLFYYIAGRYLHSISFDKQTSNFLSYSVDTDAFNLVLYQNYLLWVHQTDSGEHYVNSYDLNAEKSSRDGLLANTSFDIVDMKVLDKRLQMINETSPCAHEDGGCSQICVTKYTNDEMTLVCECRLGYTLDKDNHTCNSTIVDDNFVIVADSTNNELLQINLENNSINAIPNLDNDEYRGVFMDPVSKRIVWAENYDRNIYSANLNGTDQRILSNLGISGYPYRFDKDMTTGNLYFTAYYDSFIGVVTPSGGNIVLNSVFTWTDLGDIVVHPAKGALYYTASGYQSQYVGRSDMDGENSVELIKGNHVNKPDGLAIDFINDHLYWSDSKFDTIQRCNLDGEDCVTILNMTGTYRFEEIKDLVTDGEYLYYSAYKKDHVVRVELKPPYSREVMGQSPGIGKLDTVAFYSSKNKNIQPVSNACKDRNGRGDCSTICFPTQIDRSCACEKGVSLKADGRTCANVYQCTGFITQTVLLSGGTESPINVTFSSSCLRHLHDKCRYRCPVNFVPILDTLLTCTNVGWNMEPETLCQELRCPASIDNGRLDPNCTREVGRTCDYQCNKGYLKTSAIVICTENGTYQTPEIALCTLVKCPSTIPNGEITGKCDKNFGGTCDFKCNDGYRVNGSALRTTCSSNGQWHLADNTCIEIMCPGTIKNGKLSPDCNGKIGAKCNYTCDDGFIRTREKVFCTRNGTYHIPESGLCTPYKCSSEIANGVLDKDCERTLGATCVYSCNKYFTATVGDKKTVCHDSGWSPASTDLCKESVCTNTSLTNGDITGNCSSKVGEKCTFQCSQGFVNTTNVIVCQDNLQWHPKTFCTAFKCSDQIENGALEDGCARTIGSSCQFNCNEYFYPTIQQKLIQCEANGWNPMPSSLCKESLCENNTLPNGQVAGTCKSKVGVTCVFQCDSGYVKTTDGVFCQGDRTWHPTDACTAYTCSDEIENGRLDPQCTRTIGSSCKYSCNKFYKSTVEENTITCQADGWKPDSTDLCKESECNDETLKNGEITGQCQRRIGETCMFQCSSGYVNTTSEVVCRGDIGWHPTDACTAFTCSNEIENGKFDPGCTRAISASCKYSCNKYYTASVTDNEITCQREGWSPVSTELCKESECEDGTLNNGKITGKCERKIGETCMFQCSGGYVNTTDEVVCQDDRSWQPTDACTAYTCGSEIENGRLDPGCTRTIGSSCKYSCNEYFTASIPNNEVTCQADGWNPISSALCKVSTCEDSSVSYGKITGNCSKVIGEVCEFKCDNGYVNTTQFAVCKNDQMWHPRESCNVVKCPTVVPDGEITETCDFSIGANCTFKCDDDFTANILYSSISCHSSGQWDASEELCLATECKDSSLSYGKISGTCQKTVGETCTIECNQGYINTTSVVVCRKDYFWHPMEACIPMRCSPYIPNGEITWACDLAIGTTCNFTCYDDFKANYLEPNITCNSSGHWNVTQNLCLEQIHVSKTDSLNGLSVPGIAAGLAILVLLVFVLIGVIIFLIRRHRSNSLHSTSKSVHHGGRSTAFENPGYIQNVEPSVQTTNVDLAQMQPMSFSERPGTATGDEGIINPIYDNEPLPDIAQIDVTNDTAVLTNDSWLREKKKKQLY